MKRGLVFWDQVDWPEEEFRLRVDGITAALRGAGLDALLIYGDACQSGALSYLTHFIPYADTGLLVLPAEGSPKIFTTHALRNMAWFKTITWVNDIVCTSHIGPDCAEHLRSLGGRLLRIGTVPKRIFPKVIASAVRERTGARLMDFTRTFEGFRAAKSDREIAYVRKAGEIAAAGLAALTSRLRPGVTGYEVAAEVEWTIRGLGSEDLICLIRADDDVELTLPSARQILRSVSIEIAVEFNAYWAKMGRTMLLDGPRVKGGTGRERFEDACLAGIETWSKAHSVSAFREALQNRWDTPLSLQVDYGLEPYWGMNAFSDIDESVLLDRQGSIFIQLSSAGADRAGYLWTDTLIFKQGDLEPITGIHRSGRFTK